MRKALSIVIATVVLTAAGFAGASIATGASLAGFSLTGTGTTGTTTTGTTKQDRKVTVCHRTGSKKHPSKTIRISERALAAHLRHGDKLGACAQAKKDDKKKKDKKDDRGNGKKGR